MAAYTSVQSGSRTDPATWGEVTNYPGINGNAGNDTFTVSSGHVVTDPGGLVGSGASGSASINVLGTYTIQDNSTVELDGELAASNGTINIGQTLGGAALEFQGTYKFEYFSVCYLNINGFSDNRCSYSAIASNYTWIERLQESYALNVDANYCDFTRMGDQTAVVNATNFSGAGNTTNLEWRNCKFDTVYRLQAYFQGERPLGNSTFKIIDCDFRNMPGNDGYQIVLGQGGSFNFNANTHEISGCTFSPPALGGRVYISLTAGTNKFLINDNVIDNTEFFLRVNHEFKRNIVKAVDTHEGNDVLIDLRNYSLTSDVHDNIVESSFNNSHVFAPKDAGGMDARRNYIWLNGGGIDSDNAFLPAEADCNSDILNNVVVGGNAVVVRANRASNIVTANNNTHIGYNSADDAHLIIEDLGYRGQINAYNNIEYSVNPNTQPIWNDVSPTPLGLDSDCNTDYNCYHDVAPASRYGNLTISGKVLGDAGFGGSDVDADPQFNNVLATWATWDTFNGGVGTIQNAIDEAMKRNGFDKTGAATSFNSSYSWTAAESYFRISFSPSNLALQGTGLGGVDIGALSVVEDQIVEVPGIDSVASVGNVDFLQDRIIVVPGIDSVSTVGDVAFSFDQFIEVPGIDSVAFVPPVTIGYVEFISQYPNIMNAIKIFAPQYGDTNRSESLIPYAIRMTAVDCYGDRADDAVALRVCHMMALEERNGGSSSSSGDGTSGTIKSEKEGDLARTYSNAVSDNDTCGVWGTLPSTTYGQMLIEMAQGSFMTVRNRFSGNC